MKRLLAVLFAVAVALPVAADTQVVCSISAQAETACSALTVSQAGQLDPCRCNQNAPAPAGPFGGHATLADGLVSYWPLDEESGVRADAVGSNDLTDNNTVGYVNLGPQGVVADFVAASSEYLDRAATIPRDGTSFTLAFWAYIPDPGAATSRWYVSQGNQTAWISKQNEVMAIDVVGGGEAYATTSMAGMAAGWFFIVAGYNSATGKSFVSVNDGAVSVSAGTSTGVSTDANFQLGRVSGGGAGTVYFDDAMGRIGLWNSVLAASEITSLYNSGLGKSYADLTAAEKVGLVSYWNLDEASGNRADSHGSNTLTDNNTVTSVDNTHPGFGKAASFVTANTESLSIAVGPIDPITTVSMWVSLANSAAGDKYGQVFALKDGLFFVAFGKQDGGTTFFAAEEYSSAWYETVSTKSWTANASYLGWNNLVFEVNDTAHTLTGYLNGAIWVGPISYSNPWGTGVAATKAIIGPSGIQYTGSMVGPSLSGHNPLIAHVGLWSRVLTAQERTDLYAAGAGLFYED